MDITLEHKKRQGALIFLTTEIIEKQLVFIARATQWNPKINKTDSMCLEIEADSFSSWYERKLSEGWKITAKNKKTKT